MSIDSTTSLAVEYLRFSPRPDAEEAKSNEVQHERNLRYCALKDLRLVESFSDPNTSARKIPLDKRDGGKAMLEYVAANKIKHIVVMSLSRIFRRTVDGMLWLERWQHRGISLHLSDEGGNHIDCSTAKGELIATFLLGVTSFEPRQTAERTSVAMKHHQQNGLLQSGRPKFGFKRGPDKITVDEEGKEKVIRTVVADPEEMLLGEQMRELHDVYGMGCREIAREMERQGFKFRGGRFHHTMVSRVLKDHAAASTRVSA